MDEWACLVLFESDRREICARFSKGPKKYETRYSALTAKREEILAVWSEPVPFPQGSDSRSDFARGQFHTESLEPNEDTCNRLFQESHWSERQLEALCFGIRPIAYRDRAVPNDERGVVRQTIREACGNGGVLAEKTGAGNPIYGGEWPIERLSAVRWADDHYAAFPKSLVPDLWRETCAKELEVR